MKIDGLGILMVIIIFPIILIVSYFIKLQVNTVAMENNYNTKLIDATYDAMAAFELNTANEELSNVSDSIRSIIEASNNTLLNTLATNLGMSNASKELFQPYIPAVLYTLYDGYYIYSPAEVPIIYENVQKNNEASGNGLIISGDYHYIGDSCGNGDGHSIVGGNYGDVIYYSKNGKWTTNESEALMQKDYILKPYMQYSGRYSRENIDVTINYSLDNYLNIEGKIGDVYYTKTGYLIRDGLVSGIKVDENEIIISKTNEDYLKNKILGKKMNSVSNTIAAAKKASVTIAEVGKIEAEWNTISNNLGEYQNLVFTVGEVDELIKEGKITDNNVIYEVQKYKAIAYYSCAACFSDWVYDKLKNLQYGDIKQEAIRVSCNGYQTQLGSSNFFKDFDKDTTRIFDKNEDPEISTSKFNTHKLEVIKNSIKYNLNLVISNYKNSMNSSYDFSLPIIEDDEWDKILSNVSIVSFMQGWNCGLDIYNNYAIAVSTNNELMVNESEIYYVYKEDFNSENSYYHRIDCNKFTSTTKNLISFTSKEIKYDKLYNKISGKYEYDHKNLACYSCINTANYGKGNFNKLERAIGIGCQKQGLYKINALSKSEGYKVDNVSDSKTLYFYKGSGGYKIPNLSDVKEISITIKNTSRARNSTDGYVQNIKLNGGKYSLSNTQDGLQTITIDVNDVDMFNLKVDDSYTEFSHKVDSIKYVYK